MMRPSHKNPKQVIHSPPKQTKNSPPQQSKMPTSAEGMLKGLETRFKTIHQKVLELLDRKEEIQKSNAEAIKTFEEDIRSHEESLNQLQQEISQLSIKNNDLIIAYQRNKENKTPMISNELVKANRHLSDLQEQMKTILESIKGENNRTDALEKQIVFFRKEGIDVDAYLKSPLKKSPGQKSPERNSPSREQTRDLREDLSSFPRYQKMLKKSSTNSPQNELDVLLNISPRSGRRIRNVENLQEQLREITEESEHLRYENEKLKKKIMANMHSDYEKPVYDVQHTDREVVEHAKKQQKLKISKLFADEDKLISHISHHTRDGVITKGEDEYIKKKDAQNEENFRRILEIKELERLREQIYQQEAYINELERNVIEREHLLFDQKREINSLEDNLRNLHFDIQQNVLEKDLLDKKYKEKNISIEEMRERYDETIRALPENHRPRPAPQESPKFSNSPYGTYSSSLKSKEEDDDLEDLLNKAPKALNFRKN